MEEPGTGWMLSLAFDEFSRVAFVVTSRPKTSCCRHDMNAATFLFQHIHPPLLLCPTRHWTLHPGFLLMQASVFVQSLTQTQANCMVAKRARDTGANGGRGEERERDYLSKWVISTPLASSATVVASLPSACTVYL